MYVGPNPENVQNQEEILNPKPSPSPNYVRVGSVIVTNVPLVGDVDNGGGCAHMCLLLSFVVNLKLLLKNKVCILKNISFLL